MATFQLAQVKGGGGGVYKVEAWVTNQTMSAGVTGDLVTIGTAGKLTVLTYLTTSTPSTQEGMGLRIDGVVIKEDELLCSRTPISASQWGIYRGSPSANTSGGASSLESISGEFITITKTAGNTINEILYSYTTGST
jgi:hypothetical protein